MAKVDAKLMKFSLNCAKFKLNEAIDEIKLVLNCAKSQLNQAIDNTMTKLDTKLK